MGVRNDIGYDCWGLYAFNILTKKPQGFQTPGQYAPQADGEGTGRRQHGPGGNAQ